LTKVTAKHFIAILGWNSSGENILESITDVAIRDDRTIVLVNKHRPEEIETIINKHHQLYIKYVFGDPTDEEVLVRANMQSAHSAIVIPDEEALKSQRPDEGTILTTLSVKSLNAKIKVIAHLLKKTNEQHLQKANADHIVVDSKYSGYLLSAHVTDPGIPEAIDKLLGPKQNIKFKRKSIPKTYLGKPFVELIIHFKQTEDLLLIGLLKESTAFALNDILSDDYSSIDAFIKEKLESAGKGLTKQAQLDIDLNPSKDYTIMENDVGIVLERSL
jgi:voltage-gated potassium channel